MVDSYFIVQEGCSRSIAENGVKFVDVACDNCKSGLDREQCWHLSQLVEFLDLNWKLCSHVRN